MNNNISLYIGIDVSKEKHDICIKNHDGKLLKRFQITNTKDDLDKLYAAVGKLRNDISDNFEVLFGMEATGIYYFPLYSALNRDGYSVKIYNPIQTYGYRKMEIRKTKTDLQPSLLICCVTMNRLLQLRLIIWNYINYENYAEYACETWKNALNVKPNLSGISIWFGQDISQLCRQSLARPQW